MQSNFDVIIIGAGISGLESARLLTNRGLSVCVLEARERTGGRIHTHRFKGLDVPVELGAEFIHGEPTLLLQHIQNSSFEVTSAGDRNFDSTDAGLVPSTFMQDVEPVLRKLSAIKDDISFNEFLHTQCQEFSHQQKARAYAFVEGFNAAAPNEISALALGRENKEGESASYDSSRIVNGFDQVIRSITDQIDTSLCTILLKSTATSIVWEPGSVTITVKPTTEEFISLTAKKLLCTIPSPLLADDKFLKFTPDIATKREHAFQVGTGSVLKVVGVFDTPWWNEDPKIDGFSFIFGSEQAFSTWWTIGKSSPVLIGWAGGTKATALHGKSKEELNELTLITLASIFKRSVQEIAKHVVELRFIDWQNDPFSLGAYAFQKAGHPNARAQLAEPIENTLFFAGDATESTGIAGTVEAALASAHRVAKEMLLQS